MKSEEYKQAIIIRKDLKLPIGKACAQSSHASVEAVLRSDKDIVKKWHLEGMKKVVLKVADEKELLIYNQIAKDAGLVTAVIQDAGLTVVKPGTRTCLAIGPDKENKIDAVTSDLSLL